VAFGQLSKTQDASPKLGYNLDLAFQIVSLSFPLTIVLNTATALGGDAYVNGLPLVGLGLCALSQVVYRVNKGQIDEL